MGQPGEIGFWLTHEFLEGNAENLPASGKADHLFFWRLHGCKYGNQFQETRIA